MTHTKFGRKFSQTKVYWFAPLNRQTDVPGSNIYFFIQILETGIYSLLDIKPRHWENEADFCVQLMYTFHLFFILSKFCASALRSYCGLYTEPSIFSSAQCVYNTEVGPGGCESRCIPSHGKMHVKWVPLVIRIIYQNKIQTKNRRKNSKSYLKTLSFWGSVTTHRKISQSPRG